MMLGFYLCLCSVNWVSLKDCWCLSRRMFRPTRPYLFPLFVCCFFNPLSDLFLRFPLSLSRESNGRTVMPSFCGKSCKSSGTSLVSHCLAGSNGNSRHVSICGYIVVRKEQYGLFSTSYFQDLCLDLLRVRTSCAFFPNYFPIYLGITWNGWESSLYVAYWSLLTLLCVDFALKSYLITVLVLLA